MDVDTWKERFIPEVQRENDIRTHWEKDFARIIHSAGFRRLQAKTQVLGLGESDFYRTRLTHSMEVAQIGVGILKKLRHDYASPQNEDENEIKKALPTSALINSICMAHDLGHPPFGHGGEVALNLCMRDYGGFEGNGQTLRILSKLEKSTENNGLNPTRRLLLGVLKYPASYKKMANNDKYGEIPSPKWLCKSEEQKPPKCYLDDEKEIVEWILRPLEDEEREEFVSTSKNDKLGHNKPEFQGLDTSIMELADDISYSLHDLEDAISLGLVSKDDWRSFADLNEHSFHICNLNYEDITNGLFSKESYLRKKEIGTLVNHFVSNVNVNKTKLSHARTPLIKWNAVLNGENKKLLKTISSIVINKVIKMPNVQQLEFKGQRLIIELFDVLKSDPMRLLPESTKAKYCKAKEVEKMRVICDFISGMTDEYATRLYEKLCNPHKGSIFDRL